MKTKHQDQIWMSRCLELAKKGHHQVSENPMVGAVLVHDGKIIGEGYHHQFGGDHAEVIAINAVKDRSLLKTSCLYVSLEPCAHFGKTPPCSAYIVEHQIPKVVIATIDPFSEVSGKGIEKLKAHNIEVVLGILEAEARFLNRRFFVFHKQKRPYLILKWAESADGFIDKERTQNETGSFPISQTESQYLNHRWRAEEDAILVGYQTALVDNPKLNTRAYFGQNPLRLVIDKHQALPKTLNLFDQTIPTWKLSEKSIQKIDNQSIEECDIQDYTALFSHLYDAGIQSVLVEGGGKTHALFYEQAWWDEIRIIKSKKNIQKGKKALQVDQTLDRNQHRYLSDTYIQIINPKLEL
ncbi:MAG: bifunctional diaminohydroxyphosphoribosylaminopyrimidine deaminase/5-amino-6-(5-phosphoribosylamino)uracil reductase RibD [Flavobacteriales bacterium]